MPIVVDLYIERDSWVHKVDPRVKLLFVAAVLVLLLVFRNVFIFLTALGLVHLLHWSAKMPARNFKFIWKTLLPVGIMMLVLWVVFYPVGEPLFRIWFIKVTMISVAQGLVLSLRIMSMAFVVFAWLYTTDQQSLIRSLVKLKLPYDWCLVLALALRYIPTFQGMYGIISQAQQSRGLDISQGSGYKRVKVMMPIFISMVISSMRASEQLARALESRAFGARGVKRTTLYDIHFCLNDYFYMIVIMALFFSLMFLNIHYGFGTHPISF